MRRLVIGTRGSKLALWQTNWIKSKLEQAYPELLIDTRVITTTGDRVTDVALPKLGEQAKGLFTKELEEEMLGRRTDIAVHSLKDLPTELPPGLCLAVVTEREDVRDAFIARNASSLDELPAGAVVGTSSLRRQAQLLRLRPDLRFEPARGNVDTRLRRLEEGKYDALILASAGLRRLGYAERITSYLDADLMMPAPGQGAIAIEARSGDSAVLETIRAVEHLPTRRTCEAERAFLRGLGGGCLVPIASLATITGESLSLSGLVARPDGSEIVKGEEAGRADEAESIGLGLAEKLLRAGAGRILSSK